ncbi:YaaC family protein [Aeribacillus sp. FSL K6-8210]|uniref:YaaC family protein n=1 Tax=Aeribacillus sp. FSL K6-8210 TaxID=2954683 RepID=UPI0030D59344
MSQIISYKGKNLTLHKAIKSPNFEGKTVLVNDPWEYVEMWLKRNNHNDEALFYWQQSRQFYEASTMLPLTSSPLTTYYCFLNAVKTLLIVKNVPFSDRHGVSGWSKNSKVSLSNEYIKIQTGGILPALCNYLDEPVNTAETYLLRDVLYNLPFIHRAYCLTYTSTSTKELFIPIRKAFFVKKNGSSESWFSAEIDPKYANGHTLKKVAENFERDPTFENAFVVRTKKRFRWRRDDPNKLNKLVTFHCKIRKQIHYIAGMSRLWYIKREGIDGVISRNPMSLTFAGMHRLSELSRYEPVVLSKHLSSQHNWLLSEFIKNAPYQFIDHIASEITGEEFMSPGIVTRRDLL